MPVRASKPGRSLAPQALLVLGLCAALAPHELRPVLVAAAGALLALAVPAMARWPLAILVGAAVLRGGWPTGVATVAALVALVLWPRPKTLGRRLVVLAATAAIVAATTHDARATLAAAASVALLLAPIEGHAPRIAIGLALAVAAVPGLWALRQAQLAQRSARSLGTDDAWTGSQSRCAELGWRRCEEDARVARAQLARKRGDDAAALALLDGVGEPARPGTELLHADTELALGKSGPAHSRLKLLADLAPSASTALSPQASIDWAHALLRVGKRELAAATLRDVPGPEAARLLALASAPPTPTAPGEISFSHAIALRPSAMPGACVKRGETVPVHFDWRVGDGFSTDEGYRAFVHAYGPGRTLFFDHELGGRRSGDLAPAEQLSEQLPGVVAADAPAGSYTLEVGLYEPGSNARMRIDGLPTHISFATLGTFEVCR